MKNSTITQLFLLTTLLLFSYNSYSQRYISEIFTDVSVTNDVQYASNISVLSGAPNLEILYMDVYEPVGDIETERPVIIIAHGGEYLPPQLNGLPYGDKKDSAIVHLCNKLAKRGFVAISYNYRLGWNPTATTQETRTGTYLNAQYRASQDGFSVVRFLRMNVDIQSNTFGIDTTRIISGGLGVGGQTSASIAFLDRYEEMAMYKFMDPFGQPYVDSSLSGNVYGTTTRPLNMSNNSSYENDIDFAFNLGGYVSDSTWIEAGDVPMVSFGLPLDPFAPFDHGAIITQTNGDFVANGSGSKGIQSNQAILGNNLPFTWGTYSDAYTTQANLNNSGLDGLYPFITSGPEVSPWNYWDFTTWNIPHPNGGTFNDQGLLTNPGMSLSQSNLYLDTVVNYLCPRIVCALNLPGCTNASLEEEQLISIQVYPNPNDGQLFVELEQYISIIDYSIVDLNGRIILSGVLSKQKSLIDIQKLKSGVYLIQVEKNTPVRIIKQ